MGSGVLPLAVATRLAKPPVLPLAEPAPAEAGGHQAGQAPMSWPRCALAPLRLGPLPCRLIGAAADRDWRPGLAPRLIGIGARDWRRGDVVNGPGKCLGRQLGA